MKTVVYAGTENMYYVMYVSLVSLLLNNKIDRVYLLIEHNSFPYPIPDKVKVINVKNQSFFPPSGANYNARWTYMSMMRCALSKMLKNKKVLWLDCDTIVDGDISELFEMDMTGMWFAGAREPAKCIGRTYINTGVCLLNLEQIRKDKVDDRMIDILNRVKYPLPDQDVINEQGRIIVIDSMYNACPFTEPTEIKKIYHFAANMYFRNERMFKKYERMIK